MATDTVPAAVPGPNDPHGNTADPATTDTRPGGLAGLLAPVQPARSAAFNIQPTLGDGTADQAVEGASSASYTTPDTPQPDSKTPASGRKETRVVRAWMLAGAERWKQGGIARVKRLEYLKAKAAANQVKVARTESVNNRGGFLGTGRGGGSGKGTGKDLAGKSPSGSVKGPKNTSPGPSRKNSGSRNGSGSSSGGSGGRGSSGGNGQPGAGGCRTDTRTPSPRKPSAHKDAPKTPGKDHSPKNHRGPGPGSTGSGGAGKANGSGTGSSGKGSHGGQGSAGKDRSPGTKGPDAPGGNTRKTPASKDHNDTRTPKTDLTKKPKPVNADKTSTPGRPAKDTHSRPDIAVRKDDTQDPKNTPGKDTPGKPSPTQKAPTSGGTNPAAKPAPGPRLNLRESREAGYRDGTRAAKLTAHVEAWRDGARDGWTDTRQAAAHEKTRLDKAHADHKTARTEPPKDTPMPTPTTTNSPRPVQVLGIDATHLHLGDGAARTHISRGEVRTLRQFQNRLNAKTERMTRVTEATRALEQHAHEQADKVTQLLEQAQAVKGGDKLIGALTKLQEAANAQAAKAAEIHTRAVRAADACKALAANTETRWGGIYQAVVNSPETAPAELAYYREMAHA
jgi:hypothetical protein